jgi:hypothetical protein
MWFWADSCTGLITRETYKFITMEQRALKIINNCLNTNIFSYLETPGGQSYFLYLNFAHFFQHQCQLDICGILKQLFSFIGV